MYNLDYTKKVIITLFAAAVAIPGIAIGFYTLYRIVKFAGS